MTQSKPYDTKTIRCHVPEWGQYVYVTIIEFGGEGHILGEIGYTGSHYLFIGMSLNKQIRVADTDLHEWARKHPLDVHDTLAFDLLYALDTGRIPWGDIEDGQQFDEALLREYVDRAEAA